MNKAEKQEMTDDDLRRVHVHFVGHVQGVGFRWTTQQIAQRLGLTGWVKNVWDGSVTCELQGNNASIKTFFGLLQKRYHTWHIDYRIDDMQDLPLKTDEHDFKIRITEGA